MIPVRELVIIFYLDNKILNFEVLLLELTVKTNTAELTGLFLYFEKESQISGLK